MESGATAVEHARGQSRTTLVSLGVAAALVALKLGVGLATASLGLVSAGIESSGDVIAAAVTVFAVRLGRRPADRGHPYGHRRAENLGALGEAAILLAGAAVVATEAARRLVDGGEATHAEWYLFAVVLTAMVLDGARVAASRKAARRYGSPALRGNAMHFAGDLAGSLAVLGGLLAVRAGWRDGDAVAALTVTAIMLVATTRLVSVNANVLMDRTPWEARAAAEHAIREVGEGIELSRLRLRESAGRYFADVVVSAPPGQALVESHRSADLVEAAVERALPGSDVVVHVEPRARGLALRERVLAIALAEPLVKEAHDISVFSEGAQASVSLHLKFPHDVDLRTAHESAERVERAVAALPEVADVQTHLEPLEGTVAAAPAREGDGDEQAAQSAALRLARERTGTDARRVRVLATDAGLVVFITLALDAGQSLTAAHALAGELEDELHRAVPSVAEVVVHTEP